MVCPELNVLLDNMGKKELITTSTYSSKNPIPMLFFEIPGKVYDTVEVETAAEEGEEGGDAVVEVPSLVAKATVLKGSLFVPTLGELVVGGVAEVAELVVEGTSVLVVDEDIELPDGGRLEVVAEGAELVLEEEEFKT